MRFAKAGSLRSRAGGFTLLETLIASSLLLLVVGLTVNFISGFNKTGNRTVIQATLEESLRNSLNRLESELLEISAVLPSSGGDTTGANTLVASLPVYNSLGLTPMDSTGAPLSDTLVLKKVTDAAATKLIRSATSSVSPDKLQISLSAQGESKRATISSQTIANKLMPKDSLNPNIYSFPSTISSGSNTLFRYYTSSGSEIGTVTSSNAAQIALIRVTLWAEESYGGQAITAKKELDIRLRNWGPSPTPTP